VLRRAAVLSSVIHTDRIESRPAMSRDAATQQRVSSRSNDLRESFTGMSLPGPRPNLQISCVEQIPVV